jgi:hypothetical protein
MRNQLELPLAAKQKRNARREPAAVHAMVMRLRRAGRRVYRAGRDVVLVDGARVPLRRLMADAARQ